MALYKSILGTFLVLAAAAHAQGVKCPSHQGNQPLSRVSVFDGPPAENADLAPDIQTGGGDHIYLEWEVSSLSSSDRGVFLVCRYAASGDEPSLTIKLDKKMRRCIYRSHGGGLPAEAECN
jgi:hypothetical protein